LHNCLLLTFANSFVFCGADCLLSVCSSKTSNLTPDVGVQLIKALKTKICRVVEISLFVTGINDDKKLGMTRMEFAFRGNHGPS